MKRLMMKQGASMTRSLILVCLSLILTAGASAQACQACLGDGTANGTNCVVFNEFLHYYPPIWRSASIGWRNCYVTLAPLGFARCRVSVPCFNFDVAIEGDTSEYEVDPVVVRPDDLVEDLWVSLGSERYYQFEDLIDRGLRGIANPKDRARFIMKQYRAKLREVNAARGFAPNEISIRPSQVTPSQKSAS